MILFFKKYFVKRNWKVEDVNDSSYLQLLANIFKFKGSMLETLQPDESLMVSEKVCR